MDNHKVLPYSEGQVMMINETILCLIVSDCSGHRLGKYPELDIGLTVNLDRDIYESLKQIFTRVIRYEYIKRYVEVGVRMGNQEIIDIVKAERPKYVLWRSRNYEIQEATFQEIRKEGTIVVGWFYDDEWRFDDYSKWWVPYLDYVLTCDRESVKKYEELGGRAFFSLVYSDPDSFKRLEMPKKYDVSFVGANYSNRTVLVNALKERGIMVNVFGEGWEAGHVSFDEMVNICNASKINLSFMQSYNTTTRPQMKSRIFDICMCGGFLLCEYIPGIEEFYEIDKEIVCFRDIEEAADKIKYYLSHENEREMIAQAGWERAHRDYTMAKRLAEVFQEIERDGSTKAYEAQPAPEVLEMPCQIRKLPSAYHLSWGKALLRENYKKLWNDELELSISYDPSNRQARHLYAIGRFPPLVRPWLIRLYPALSGLGQVLLSRLRRLFG
jgi:hypothetical protein